jgi:hypothetical protein
MYLLCNIDFYENEYQNYENLYIDDVIGNFITDTFSGYR